MRRRHKASRARAEDDGGVVGHVMGGRGILGAGLVEIGVVGRSVQRSFYGNERARAAKLPSLGMPMARTQQRKQPWSPFTLLCLELFPDFHASFLTRVRKP
jgi:hypothetical protein